MFLEFCFGENQTVLKFIDLYRYRKYVQAFFVTFRTNNLKLEFYFVFMRIYKLLKQNNKFSIFGLKDFKIWVKFYDIDINLRTTMKFCFCQQKIKKQLKSDLYRVSNH